MSDPPRPPTNEEILEITAAPRSGRTSAPLPFRPGTLDDELARAKALISGSRAASKDPPRAPQVTSGLAGRQSTQELVVDPAAHPGLAPAWLGPQAVPLGPPPAPPPPPAMHVTPAPPAPPPPAPPAVNAPVTGHGAAPAPALSAPVAAEPPPPVEMLMRAPPVAPKSLAAASAAAMEMPARAPSAVPAPPLVPLSAADPIAPALGTRPPTLPPGTAWSPSLTPDVVKLGEVDSRALGSAAAGGVLAASNAAAGARKEPPPRKTTAPEPAAAEAKSDPAGHLELLWMDRAVVPRLRAHAVFGSWMKPPPKAAPGQQGKPPPPPPPPEAVEKAERADVRNILSKDPQAAVDPKAGQDAEDDPDPPIVLVQGALSFPFEREDVLKAVMAAAKPLSATDRKLKEALDLAAEVLKGDYEATEAFESLTAKIREAWQKANRTHPPGHLDARAEQALLGERKYQKRTLLDGEWIRALLTHGAGDPTVVYLPVAIEKRLPIFARFPVKMLCKLHPPQDADEASPAALEVVAIARVTARPKIAR